MKKLVVLLLITAWAVLLPGTGAAAPRAVHVVDDDRRQCAQAEHTSIQAAVDAAETGDVVRVCPGTYVERVVVDQPLTIKGQPDAVESVDCFAAGTSRLDDLDPTRHAIVQAPADTTPAQPEPDPLVRLDADDVELSGLVLQGAPAGTLTNLYTAAVQTSQDHSGFRVHHNLIRLNTLGVELGSSGTHLTRFDHNCLRENTWHLANQRLELEHARVDHNATTRSVWFAYEVGWSVAPVRDAVFDHNTSKGERQAFYVENSTGVRISHNTIEPTLRGIGVMGGNTGLQVLHNTVAGGSSIGIHFLAPVAPVSAVSQARVHANTVSGMGVKGVVGSGIGVSAGATDSTSRAQHLTITDNVLTDNGVGGLQLQARNTRNLVRGNVAERNGLWGIAARGATGNVIVGNRMLDNPAADAHDQLGAGANTWRGNHCGKGDPAVLCATTP